MAELRVRVVTASDDAAHTDVGFFGSARPAASYAGWSPRLVLGAESPGGLMLPSATPTASSLYAPRAVTLVPDADGGVGLVIAADTGNHRLLIWHGLPDSNGAPADVVLGQPDLTSEGPAAGGRGPANGFHLPTGVLVHEGRLVVADAWHHRVLVWDAVPTAHDTPPDHVLGQPDLASVDPNAGGDAGPDTFYWPFGIAMIGGRFHVADTGNRRVLIWDGGLPEPGRPADVVLGQPDPTGREENRGGPVAADSFRWPHAFASSADGALLVADAGNHRLLRWDTPPDRDRPADAVLGQPDFETGTEFPYVPQINRMRFPYAIATHGDDLAIADTANSRILIQPGGAVADQLEPVVSLGQPDLAANGENRWDRVDADTLCWPYGLDWLGGETDLLAVADSGNNRVVVWEFSRAH
jgi:hypothetical protein